MKKTTKFSFVCGPKGCSMLTCYYIFNIVFQKPWIPIWLLMYSVLYRSTTLSHVFVNSLSVLYFLLATLNFNGVCLHTSFKDSSNCWNNSFFLRTLQIRFLAKRGLGWVMTSLYSGLDSFGSSTVPGHL